MHMDIYADARKSSFKRFYKPHRMMLIQGDLKYGPYLPIGKNGKMIRTYLSSAIDDHSRYILSSEFYDNQEEAVVSDTFRKAILKYGKFDKLLFKFSRINYYPAVAFLDVVPYKQQYTSTLL